MKACKQQLDAIYEEKAKYIKIRSKWNWYELGEKHRAIQSQIHCVIINQDEICFRVKFRIKQTKCRHI